MTNYYPLIFRAITDQRAPDTVAVFTTISIPDINQ